MATKAFRWEIDIEWHIHEKAKSILLACPTPSCLAQEKKNPIKQKGTHPLVECGSGNWCFAVGDYRRNEMETAIALSEANLRHWSWIPVAVHMDHVQQQQQHARRRGLSFHHHPPRRSRSFNTVDSFDSKTNDKEDCPLLLSRNREWKVIIILQEIQDSNLRVGLAKRDIFIARPSCVRCPNNTRKATSHKLHIQQPHTAPLCRAMMPSNQQHASSSTS